MTDNKESMGAGTFGTMEIDEDESDYGDDVLDGADLDTLETNAIVEKVTQGLIEKRSTFNRDDLDRALRSDMNITDAELRAKLILSTLAHKDTISLTERGIREVARYTTRAVLVEEQQLLKDADALSEMGQLLNDADASSDVGTHDLHADQQDAVLQRHAMLNQEQKDGVRHLTTAAGLAVLRGEAGTGKSKVIAVVREAYEKAGRPVLGLSLTNDVVQDLRRSAGFDYVNTVHGELEKLKNNPKAWKNKPVVVVDEAAMLSTQQLGTLLSETRKAGAKLIAVGDDRQLPSVERGGMFGAMADFCSAKELHEVLRVKDPKQKRAFNHFHEGEFKEGLIILDDQNAIHWSESLTEARRNLVVTWARDTAAAPEKTRMVFAFINDHVDQLNVELRAECRNLGRLGSDHVVKTKRGPLAVAIGDRLQFTGNEKSLGIFNGRSGAVVSIEGARLTVRDDGGNDVTFDTGSFNNFRYGYAGTIYRGQGKTVDQTYLFHTDHWRADSSYVALTRHREKTGLFVASNTLQGSDRIASLAQKMGRIEDRRAACRFSNANFNDPDRKLVRMIADINFREGLLLQVAGQKRTLDDLQVQTGSQEHGIQEKPLPIAQQGPEERVKRLKSHHWVEPVQPPAATRPVAGVSAGSAKTPLRRNFEPRPRNSIIGR